MEQEKISDIRIRKELNKRDKRDGEEIKKKEMPRL